MKSESSPSARPRSAKPRSTSPKSTGKGARAAPAKHATAAATAGHPEADLRHIVGGIVRRGLVPASAKTSISLRIDPDVLDWFKAQGAGYQTRMNAVLRAYRDASL